MEWCDERHTSTHTHTLMSWDKLMCVCGVRARARRWSHRTNANQVINDYFTIWPRDFVRIQHIRFTIGLRLRSKSDDKDIAIASDRVSCECETIISIQWPIVSHIHTYTHHTHRVCSRPFSFSSAPIGVCPLLSLFESVGWDNGRDPLPMLHITEKCKIITRKTNILLASCSDMFMFGDVCVCVCVQWIKKLHFPLYSRQRLPHYTIIVLFAVNAICLVYRYSSPFLVLLLPCYTDGFA